MAKRMGGTLSRLERELGVGAIGDTTSREWRNEVRAWVDGFAAGTAPPTLPPSPRVGGHGEWRAGLEAWAAGDGWLTRALPLAERLTGMSPLGNALADVVAGSRWGWWGRMVGLACYAADPRPWFVPAAEPTPSSGPPSTASALELLAAAHAALRPNLARLSRGDLWWLRRWGARGVNPGEVRPASGIVRLRATPGPADDLPTTRPAGQVDPGWFW
ncbi:hypothetical protein [Gemmata sp.]|uniref:hypothetical protein n=1 Tax=Gemmata sp. TaxID=1914242 RepID=UPI003F6E4AD6